MALMRIRKSFRLAFFFLAVVVSSGGNSFAEFIAAGQDAIPGQYIVVYKDNIAANMVFSSDSDNPSASEVASDLLLKYGFGNESMLYVYENSIEGFAARMDEETAKAMANDPTVLRVEEDALAYAIDTQSNATWGIDRIDQRDLPLSSTYTYNTKATNVHAYILDTGLNASHTEFTGRVGNGYDAIGDGGGTTDNNGHGTHVSGTVGGTLYGVAKGVTIHPVQVLDSQGSGSWSAIISGIDWVTSNHIKPAVANMSLGGSANSSLDDAVRKSISAGITYAVAAGNDNADACNYSPARVTEALTAGSSDRYDARSSFSNWGNCVDLFAPGSDITSASHLSTTGTKTMSGTSMASPHICGVAALYLASNPSASPATVQNAIKNIASVNKLSSVNGSPNLLLYSLFDAPPPPDEYLLRVSIVGEGSVTLDPPGGSYKPGTKVTLTAKPSTGWTFSSWSGDLTGSTNPATIVMDANKNVTATFTSDSSADSCVGYCGGQAPGGCWCDNWCSYYGDCCADKVKVCG